MPSESATSTRSAARLPGGLQRVEFDPHDGDAEQRAAIAHRFREIIAHPVAVRLDAQIAASAGSDRLDEIGPFREVAAHQRVGRMQSSLAQSRCRRGITKVARVSASRLTRASLRSSRSTALERIIGAASALAHVGIEREHDRQMILPADLRRERVGDELHALLVDGLQRLEPVLPARRVARRRPTPRSRRRPHEGDQLPPAYRHHGQHFFLRKK